MTHEVLPRVVDVVSPDARRDGVGRLMWRLAVLPELYVMHLSCIYIYSCVLMYMLFGTGWYLVVVIILV